MDRNSVFLNYINEYNYNIFTVKPYMKLPKTATFIEGEKVEMECIVYGVPTPEVSWKFGKCSKNDNYLYY